TFVIAPESEGRLLSRRAMVDAAGGRFLGHSADTIDVCGDKLEFARRLAEHNLPTVPTALFASDVEASSLAFPLVVKPRAGAGSQNTFVVRDAGELKNVRERLSSIFDAANGSVVVQPFIAGRSLSVAALVASTGSRCFAHVFPVGEQNLSRDGRFEYLGGLIP